MGTAIVWAAALQMYTRTSREFVPWTDRMVNLVPASQILFSLGQMAMMVLPPYMYGMPMALATNTPHGTNLSLLISMLRTRMEMVSLSLENIYLSDA